MANTWSQIRSELNLTEEEVASIESEKEKILEHIKARMRDKLLPCPFCGGKADIIEPIYTAPNAKKWGIVQCVKCGAEITSQYGQNHVMAAWNTRQGGAQDE